MTKIKMSECRFHVLDFRQDATNVKASNTQRQSKRQSNMHATG